VSQISSPEGVEVEPSREDWSLSIRNTGWSCQTADSSVAICGEAMDAYQVVINNEVGSRWL
jgi:hypothetical protein